MTMGRDGQQNRSAVMELDEVPVIGEIGPMPDGLDEPFWTGLQRGVLMIQRCEGCSIWIWGPQWLCPTCHRFDPAWVEVEPRGRIYSWTRTWQSFAAEFADHLPYVTVLVELPGAGGRRLLGILVDDDDQSPVIGEPVEGVIQPPSERTTHMPVLRWRRVTA
jgi:uncharacterized OB-fold protein